MAVHPHIRYLEISGVVVRWISEDPIVVTHTGACLVEHARGPGVIYPQKCKVMMSVNNLRFSENRAPDIHERSGKLLTAA